MYGGLFQFCENEEELAAAMAHAFAHAADLDVEHTGMQADPNRPPAATAWQFVTNRFTARQEEDADRLAFDVYVRAGWDPQRYENLYQRLRDKYPGNPAPDRPPLAARAQAARDRGKDASRQTRIPPSPTVARSPASAGRRPRCGPPETRSSPASCT